MAFQRLQFETETRLVDNSTHILLWTRINALYAKLERMCRTIQRKLNEFVIQSCHPEIDQDNRLAVKYESIDGRLETAGQTIDAVSAQE
jgi:hypothetical protein